MASGLFPTGLMMSMMLMVANDVAPFPPAEAELDEDEAPFLTAKAELDVDEAPFLTAKAELDEDEAPFLTAKAELDVDEAPFLPAKAELDVQTVGMPVSTLIVGKLARIDNLARRPQ